MRAQAVAPANPISQGKVGRSTASLDHRRPICRVDGPQRVGTPNPGMSSRHALISVRCYFNRAINHLTRAGRWHESLARLTITWNAGKRCRLHAYTLLGACWDTDVCACTGTGAVRRIFFPSESVCKAQPVCVPCSGVGEHGVDKHAAYPMALHGEHTFARASG